MNGDRRVARGAILGFVAFASVWLVFAYGLPVVFG